MACTELGCNPEYRAVVTDRCAGPVVTELPWQKITWNRLLDDTSEALVTVPIGCCDKLQGLDAWRHELHIIRDSSEVWVGPVVVVGDCVSGAAVKARDLSEWLAHRVIHNRHCWTPVCDPPLLLPPAPGECLTIEMDGCEWRLASQGCGGTPIGSVQAAAELIRDGLELDDPCILEFLTQIGTGVIAGRDYLPNSGYVLDAIKDLAKGALDWTVVGRRIILMPEGHSLGTTALLTCDAFTGDVCSTIDGLGDDTAPSTATRAVVRGADSAYAPGYIGGTAGGVDPHYGLLEILLEDTNIKANTTAAAQARGLLHGRTRPPLLVEAPENGGYLAPTAPVCIDDLVPGVEVPTLLDCLCTKVGQQQRLTGITVTVDASGEHVAPLLDPLGTDTLLS